jgi:hypothetical protein
MSTRHPKASNPVIRRLDCFTKSSGVKMWVLRCTGCVPPVEMLLLLKPGNHHKSMLPNCQPGWKQTSTSYFLCHRCVVHCHIRTYVQRYSPFVDTKTFIICIEFKSVTWFFFHPGGVAQWTSHQPQRQQTRVWIPPGYKVFGNTQQCCCVFLT